MAQRDIQITSILQQRPIHITSDNGNVDRDSETIKHMGEEVVWHCYEDQTAEVLFPNGSPFIAYKFVVPAGGSVCSGPAKAGILKPEEKKKSFKYNVTGPAGTTDPVIIVDK